VNAFALAFSMSGDRAAAASMFELLGPIVTTQPWSYLSQGREVAEFTDARTRAFQR
jgi:hypothetical protein